MSIDQNTIAQLLTTAAAFIIFFWISKRLFWSSILRVIEDRQKHIYGEFSRIDTLQQEVSSLKSEYSKRIGDIEAEARQLKTQEITKGREIAEQIAEQGRKEAEQMIERAKQVISIEMDKARIELREEVVRMTLSATEKIIRQQMGEAQQRRMVNDFVEELAKR